MRNNQDATEREFAPAQAQPDTRKQSVSERNKVEAFKALRALFKSVPSDIDLDKIREERLNID